MAEQERLEKERERDEMSGRIDSARKKVREEEGPFDSNEGDDETRVPRSIYHGGQEFLRKDGRRAGHTVRMLPFSS